MAEPEPIVITVENNGPAAKLQNLFVRFYHRSPQFNHLSMLAQQATAMRNGATIPEITLATARSDDYHEFITEVAQRAPDMSVHLMYQALLDRDADPEGLKIYAGQLKNGRDAISILEELLRSDECHKKFLSDLYSDLFDRPLDDFGKKIYLDQMRAGRNPYEVAAELKRSQEFVQRSFNSSRDVFYYQDHVDVEFNGSRQLNELFERYFGRPPNMLDLPSMTDYTLKLAQGYSLAEIDQAMARSALFGLHIFQQSKRDPESALASIYRGILRRNLDQNGRNHYLEMIRRGSPFNEIVSSVYNSEEYRRLILGNLYQEVFERQPDRLGTKIYLDQLAKGRELGEIAAEMRTSQEARIVMLTHMYQDAFGRNPDEQGRKIYLDQMSKGRKAKDIEGELFSSKEHLEHNQNRRTTTYLPLTFSIGGRKIFDDIVYKYCAHDVIQAAKSLNKEQADTTRQHMLAELEKFLRYIHDPNKLRDDGNKHLVHPDGFSIENIPGQPGDGSMTLNISLGDRFQLPLVGYLDGGHLTLLLKGPYPAPDGSWRVKIFDSNSDDMEKEVTLKNYKFGQAVDTTGMLYLNNRIHPDMNASPSLNNGTYDISVSSNPHLKKVSNAVATFLSRISYSAPDCVLHTHFMGAQLTALQPNRNFTFNGIKRFEDHFGVKLPDLS